MSEASVQKNDSEGMIGASMPKIMSIQSARVNSAELLGGM